VAEAGGSGGDAAGLCGTGPYRVSARGDGLLDMDAVSDHWMGAPPFRRLRWLAEPDERLRLERLLARDADVAASLSGALRATAPRDDEVRAVEVPTSTCVIFMCNARSGACADRRVRQALNHAVDVPALVNALRHGAATPSNGPLTPLHLGFDATTPAYPHDPDRARALLRDAGRGDGLEVVLDIPTETPDEAPALAALVAQHYEAAGIQTTIRTFADRPGYAQMVKQKQMDDLACFDSTPVSTYRVLREKFHAGVAGPWWQGYRNPDLDRAVDQAAREPDVERRRAIYQRAHRLIRDDAPWVFLYSPTSVTGLGPGAGPLEIRPQGLLTLTAQ
jgi:peptide/nickel transport system substrate-binding protein